MGSPDRFYEEPEPTDLDAMDEELDTRASDAADARRKGE